MAGPSLRYSEAALAYALSLANDTESSPTKSVGKASSPQVPGNDTSATVSHGTYFAEPPSPDAPLRQHRYQTGPDSTDAKVEAPLQACAESVACENSSDDRRRGMHDLVEFHDEDTGEVKLVPRHVAIGLGGRLRPSHAQTAEMLARRPLHALEGMALGGANFPDAVSEWDWADRCASGRGSSPNSPQQQLPAEHLPAAHRFTRPNIYPPDCRNAATALDSSQNCTHDRIPGQVSGYYAASRSDGVLTHKKLVRAGDHEDSALSELQQRKFPHGGNATAKRSTTLAQLMDGANAGHVPTDYDFVAAVSSGTMNDLVELHDEATGQVRLVTRQVAIQLGGLLDPKQEAQQHAVKLKHVPDAGVQEPTSETDTDRSERKISKYHELKQGLTEIVARGMVDALAAKERGRSCPATTPPTLSRQSSPHKSPATEDKPKEQPLSPQSQMHSTLLGRMEEAEAAASAAFLAQQENLKLLPQVATALNNPEIGLGGADWPLQTFLTAVSEEKETKTLIKAHPSLPDTPTKLLTQAQTHVQAQDEDGRATPAYSSANLRGREEREQNDQKTFLQAGMTFKTAGNVPIHSSMSPTPQSLHEPVAGSVVVKMSFLRDMKAEMERLKHELAVLTEIKNRVDKQPVHASVEAHPGIAVRRNQEENLALLAQSDGVARGSSTSSKEERVTEVVLHHEKAADDGLVEVLKEENKMLRGLLQESTERLHEATSKLHDCNKDLLEVQEFAELQKRDRESMSVSLAKAEESCQDLKHKLECSENRCSQLEKFLAASELKASAAGAEGESASFSRTVANAVRGQLGGGGIGIESPRKSSATVVSHSTLTDSQVPSSIPLLASASPPTKSTPAQSPSHAHTQLPNDDRVLPQELIGVGDAGKTHGEAFRQVHAMQVQLPQPQHYAQHGQFLQPAMPMQKIYAAHPPQHHVRQPAAGGSTLTPRITSAVPQLVLTHAPKQQFQNQGRVGANVIDTTARPELLLALPFGVVPSPGTKPRTSSTEKGAEPEDMASLQGMIGEAV